MKKELTLYKVDVYTDGACSGNPGPGGWGAVLVYGDVRKEISGSEVYATNQRMELVAAIEALKCLKRPCKVALYSDSAYLVNAFKQGWLDKWQANGWKTSKSWPVENRDLWEQLLDLAARHDITWHKVKGHGDEYALHGRSHDLARRGVVRVKMKAIEQEEMM